MKHTTTHQMGNFTHAIINITSLWSLPHNSSSICSRGAWWLRSRHKVHAGWHEVSNLDSSSNLTSSSAATIKFEFNYLAIPTGCELIQHKNGRQKVQVRGCIQYNNWNSIAIGLTHNLMRWDTYCRLSRKLKLTNDCVSLTNVGINSRPTHHLCHYAN